MTDRWDSTLVKERLQEFAQKVAPDHPVLGKAVEYSEAPHMFQQAAYSLVH